MNVLIFIQLVIIVEGFYLQKFITCVAMSSYLHVLGSAIIFHD